VKHKVTRSAVATVLARSQLRAEADGLKTHFSKLRRSRDPFYFDVADLDAVLRFKLRGQYARQSVRRRANEAVAVRAVTEAAFRVRSDDPDYELEVRAGLLASLPGIGVGVASAILALTEPESYGVIDVRAWRQLFPGARKRPPFTVTDYRKFMAELRALANRLGYTPQEIDVALWELDASRSQRSG